MNLCYSLLRKKAFLFVQYPIDLVKTLQARLKWSPHAPRQLSTFGRVQIEPGLWHILPLKFTSYPYLAQDRGSS